MCMNPWLWLAFCLAYSALSLLGWRRSYQLGMKHGRELERMDQEAKRRQDERAHQMAAYDAYLRALEGPRP